MTLQARAAHVDGDTEQPGLERGVTAKGLEGAQRRDEYLLRRIVGII